MHEGEKIFVERNIIRKESVSRELELTGDLKTLSSAVCLLNLD